MSPATAGHSANTYDITARFIQALFWGAEGRVELRALGKNKRVDALFVPPVDLNAIATWATTRARNGWDVYVGCATRRDASSGTLANCATLRAGYVDVDFKTTPEAEARERLARFPLPPSIVVASGGGLHAYWLLREPWHVQEDEAEIREVLRRLARRFGGDDSVAQPAAILRVPGTTNYKYTPPRPVEVEVCDDRRRYNPSELLEHLDPVPVEPGDNGHGLHLPREITQGNRRRSMFRLGRSFKRRGLSKAVAKAAALEVNRDQCTPPLEDDVVTTKIDEAYAQADRPRPTEAEREEPDDGVHTVVELADDTIIEEPTWHVHPRPTAPPEAERPPTTTAGDGSTTGITAAGPAEILAIDPATLQTHYIVTPWIPRASLCALSAKSGAGKGKLAQDLTIARATGGTWLGLRVEPGPALFWSGEQGKREDFRVTQALCRGRDLKAHAFTHPFEIVYDPALKFGHPTMLAYVSARLREHPGLLIVIDSQRRAFEGDESDSIAADAFYRGVLMPLRAEGATVLTLAHPPKTSGQQKAIADENMIRGSGDWLAQLDSFMVLRPVNRDRIGDTSETISMRLSHVKPRSGPMAKPLLVTMTVTQDLDPRVTFVLSATTATTSTEADLAGAVKAVAAFFEAKRRLSRTDVMESTAVGDYGRPAREAALKALADRRCIRGPLPKEEKQTGARGHWFVFVKPLPAPETPPDWVTDPEEDPDDL